MIPDIPIWVPIGVVAVLLLLVPWEAESPGTYNRGVLQQTSPKKLKRYVSKEWRRRGYDTEISEKEPEYVDVLAESGDEKIAISVRRRQEDNKVSRNAVERFSRSANELDANRAIMVSSSYFTEPAREKAEDSGIKLLNGDELADIFSAHDGIPN